MDKYAREEEYIIDESPLAEIQESSKGFFFLYPALRNRHYQLYCIGQIISMAGTWLQVVAQGWLVLKITQSAFLVGVVAAAATLPIFLFALFGGVLIDRFPKKQLLVFTQVASMILAFILAILTLTGAITTQEIIILAFLLGCVNAIDQPARQTFVIEMVGKQYLRSAVAINGAIATGSRAIGPGIAGILIAFVGIGGAFMINAVSYIAVIIALLFIRVKPQPVKNHLHPLRAIAEGLHYAWNHSLIKMLLIFVSILSIFGWSAMTMLPVIAQNTFHLDATGLGYLFASSGLGSIVAATFISAYSEKIDNFLMIFWGAILFSVSIIAFSITGSFLWALVFLFISGFGVIGSISTLSGMLQHLVRDDLRGRVMSMYILMFIGFSPIGNIQIGYISERYGTSVAMQIGAVIILFSTFVLLLFHKRIHASYLRHTAPKQAHILNSADHLHIRTVFPTLH